MNSIEISELKFSYDGKRRILNGVNLSVEEGEYIGIIGNSGCGKSTLCHILCGIIPHASGGKLSGRVFLYGKLLKDMEVRDIVSKVGFVMQDPDCQIVTSTVEDELAFGPENMCVEPGVIRRKVDDVLRFLDIDNLRQENPNRLSGGQKQLVAIGSVLTMDSDIIILDEPFSHLDKAGREKVKEAVDMIRRSGKTVIVVEHDYSTIRDADRWVYIENGVIKEDGLPREVERNL